MVNELENIGLAWGEAHRTGNSASRVFSFWQTLCLTGVNQIKWTRLLTTSFPGSLLFPPPGAGGRKRRDPGNEVGLLNVIKIG